MNFGHFLLGVAEGLDYGVEAGDRISAAMDNKRIRDAGKQAAKKAPQTGIVAPTQPAAQSPRPAAAPPAQRPSSLQQQASPAATIGVPQEQTAYDARFPAGIAGQYGVMGAQQPYPPPY